MSNTESLVGEIVLWTARLIGVVIFYFFIKNFVPTVFNKGWSNLRAAYSIADEAVPVGVKLQSAWVRVGTETYQGTMTIGFDESALYLQRTYFFKQRGTLRIPYGNLQLVQPPHQTKLLNIPVHGIFRVEGIDLWIGSPYAERIIGQL